MKMHAVSVWKTTSRLDKNSNKDGQPTFNCLLLQFGVVAQGVQELADLMHEVENQPATTILQVCSVLKLQTVFTFSDCPATLCHTVIARPCHVQHILSCMWCNTSLPAQQHPEGQRIKECVLCVAVCFVLPCLMGSISHVEA